MNEPTGSMRDFPDTEPASTLPMSLHGDTAFAPTEPAALMTVRAAAPAPQELTLVPIEVSLYEAMAEVRRNNRVCPQPARWLEFYRLLAGAAHGARLPAAPLTGSAWAQTPPLAKRMCFHEQVDWAAANGCLQASYDFLKGLPESDWHYGG